MKVVGNAEAIYYALDDEEAYLGATKTICSEMLILFKKQNVSRIKFFKQPNSEVLPMKQVLAGPPELDGFSWDFAIRPKSIADLRNEKLVMKRKRRQSTSPIAEPENIDGFLKPDQIPDTNRPTAKKPVRGGNK